MEVEQELKKTVTISLDIYEHFELSAIALSQLEVAKKTESGYKFKFILPSMAFSVFSVEALCNTYGSQIFDHWSHYESTSFIGKILMISDVLGLEPDFSREPWQTITKMKNFRNNLAHAKPQHVKESHTVSVEYPNRLLPFPESKKSIMNSSSIEDAEQFHNVMTDLNMVWMHNARVKGYKVNDFGTPEYKES